MGSDRHQHPAPLVSERIRMEPPRCRHDRVTDWMDANGVDALVAARPDLVTWLAGYSRYYGGLSRRGGRPGRGAGPGRRPR